MICMHLKPRSMKTHFCYFAFLNVKDMLILSKRYFLSDHSMSEGGRGLSQSLFSNLNACYIYTYMYMHMSIDFNVPYRFQHYPFYTCMGFFTIICFHKDFFFLFVNKDLVIRPEYIFRSVILDLGGTF